MFCLGYFKLSGQKTRSSEHNELSFVEQLWKQSYKMTNTY